MKSYLVFVLLLLGVNPILCADVFIQGEKIGRFLVGENLEIFTGNADVTFPEVCSSKSFQRLNAKVPNLGITSSNIWLKLPIVNSGDEINLFLEIAYPLLDEVELYTVSDGCRFKSVILSEYKHFSDRNYDHPNYVFHVNLPSKSSKVLYLRIKSIEQIILPIYLSDEASFVKQSNLDNLISGIYVGIVFIMAVYNLFLFFSIRDRSYLYYVFYIISAGITQMGIKGYSFQYLWYSWPEIASAAPIIFGCLSGISALFFAYSFLKLKKDVDWVRWGVGVFVFLFIVSIVMTFLGLAQKAFLTMQIITGLASIFVMYVSYRVMLNGYKPAKYFVYGWTVLLLGSLIFLLKDYGILGFNSFTSNAVQIASSIEMALLSFGLAYSINILKKEKEESQVRELSILQENERLIREQNFVLEEKVNERTQELTESNESLQATLTHLKETQSQLVEAEKMASLGQLTAGVAHEINNPINFVTSNVAPLKRDIKMVWDTLDEVERIAFAESLSAEEKRAQIKAYKDDVDIDYLKTEVDFLLRGMHDGASRTAEIVKSLRIFSRVDEDTLKYADINEGLASTLVILGSIIKEGVEVEKVYGDIPLIECYAGKLNQVFLNLLTNAIYAINKKFDGIVGGKLKIETGLCTSDSCIFIHISDNGIGIPDNIREKIFEPFFTTKDVGEGTGLGMSIVYNTIAKHQGEIILQSEVGVGTLFKLIIPVKQDT